MRIIGGLLYFNDYLNVHFKNNSQIVNMWTGTQELVLTTGTVSGSGIEHSICQPLIAMRVKTTVLDIAPIAYAAPDDLIFHFQCDLRDSKAIASTLAWSGLTLDIHCRRQ